MVKEMEGVLRGYRRIVLTEYLRLVEEKKEFERYRDRILKEIACGDALALSMLFMWLAGNLDAKEEVKRRALTDMALQLLIIDLENRG